MSENEARSGWVYRFQGKYVQTASNQEIENQIRRRSFYFMEELELLCTHLEVICEDNLGVNVGEEGTSRRLLWIK